MCDFQHSFRESQLTANYISVMFVPANAAHSMPEALLLYFNPSHVREIASLQSHDCRFI